MAGSGGGNEGATLGDAAQKRHPTCRNPMAGRELLRPGLLRGDICHLCDYSESKHSSCWG